MAGEEKPNSKEYTTVQLPKALSDIIDRYMAEHPEFGYRSRAEFIMDVLSGMECWWLPVDEALQAEAFVEKMKEEEKVGNEDGK